MKKIYFNPFKHNVIYCTHHVKNICVHKRKEKREYATHYAVKWSIHVTAEYK